MGEQACPLHFHFSTTSQQANMNNDQIILLHEVRSKAIRNRQFAMNMSSTPSTTPHVKRISKRLAACWTHIHNRRRVEFDASYAKLTECFMSTSADCEEDAEIGMCSEGLYNELCMLLKNIRDNAGDTAMALTNAGLWKN